MMPTGVPSKLVYLPGSWDLGTDMADFDLRGASKPCTREIAFHLICCVQCRSH